MCSYTKRDKDSFCCGAMFLLRSQILTYSNIRISISTVYNQISLIQSRPTKKTTKKHHVLLVTGLIGTSARLQGVKVLFSSNLRPECLNLDMTWPCLFVSLNLDYHEYSGRNHVVADVMRHHQSDSDTPGRCHNGLDRDVRNQWPGRSRSMLPQTLWLGVEGEISAGAVNPLRNHATCLHQRRSATPRSHRRTTLSSLVLDFLPHGSLIGSSVWLLTLAVTVSSCHRLKRRCDTYKPVTIQWCISNTHITHQLGDYTHGIAVYL